MLTVGIRVPGGYEASDERKRIMSALLAWLRDFGPVAAAGASNMIPLDDRAYLAGFPVRPIPDLQRRPKVANALRYAVTPGYAEALRLRLIEGRTFDGLDAESDVLKMIVNREFARQYLPPDPIGVRLGWGEPPEAEIVGVVGNVLKDGNDRSPRPEFYVPMAERDRLGADVLVVARMEREVELPSRLIAGYVRGLNATATVEVTWLADRLSLSIARPRFAALVLGADHGRRGVSRAHVPRHGRGAGKRAPVVRVRPLRRSDPATAAPGRRAPASRRRCRCRPRRRGTASPRAGR